jgi:hypothetical protein
MAKIRILGGRICEIEFEKSEGVIYATVLC